MFSDRSNVSGTRGGVMLLLVLAVAITAGCRSLPRDWTEREPSQDALIGLQRFFRQAQREVLALNPYLVPGEPFFAEAQLLEDRGVDMAIMTNSLGSTNQPIVHEAYARTRVPMLHAKAAVLDREHVFIGSFNFSPRFPPGIISKCWQ